MKVLRCFSLNADAFARHCPGRYECNSIAAPRHLAGGEMRNRNRRFCGIRFVRASFWGEGQAPWPSKRILGNGGTNMLQFASSLLGWHLGLYQQGRVPEPMGWVWPALRGSYRTALFVPAPAGRKCSAERKILLPDQCKAGPQNEQTIVEGEGARQRREAFECAAVSQL